MNYPRIGRSSGGDPEYDGAELDPHGESAETEWIGERESDEFEEAGVEDGDPFEPEFDADLD